MIPVGLSLTIFSNSFVLYINAKSFSYQKKVKQIDVNSLVTHFYLKHSRVLTNIVEEKLTPRNHQMIHIRIVKLRSLFQKTKVFCKHKVF